MKCSSCQKELELYEGVFKVDTGCYVYCGDDYTCMIKQGAEHGIDSKKEYLKQYQQDEGEYAYYTTLQEDDFEKN